MVLLLFEVFGGLCDGSVDHRSRHVAKDALDVANTKSHEYGVRFAVNPGDAKAPNHGAQLRTSHYPRFGMTLGQNAERGGDYRHRAPVGSALSVLRVSATRGYSRHA
jgi:hypothetical protein